MNILIEWRKSHRKSRNFPKIAILIYWLRNSTNAKPNKMNTCVYNKYICKNKTKWIHEFTISISYHKTCAILYKSAYYNDKKFKQEYMSANFMKTYKIEYKCGSLFDKMMQWKYCAAFIFHLTTCIGWSWEISQIIFFVVTDALDCIFPKLELS